MNPAPVAVSFFLSNAACRLTFLNKSSPALLPIWAKGVYCSCVDPGEHKKNGKTANQYVVDG